MHHQTRNVKSMLDAVKPTAQHLSLKDEGWRFKLNSRLKNVDFTLSFFKWIRNSQIHNNLEQKFEVLEIKRRQNQKILWIHPKNDDKCWLNIEVFCTQNPWKCVQASIRSQSGDKKNTFVDTTDDFSSKELTCPRKTNRTKKVQGNPKRNYTMFRISSILIT
jgi:hypothetical protein